MIIHELPKTDGHNGMCIVNTSRKIIFINIPKNASTSMRLKLFANGFKWGNLKKINSSEYFIFTIIRNPVDRFLSQYLEMIKRACGDNKIYGATQKPFFRIIDPKERFKSFIRTELKQGNLFEPHLQRQTWFLTGDKNEYFKIDKYILMNNMTTELKQLTKELNISLDIKNQRKTPVVNKSMLRKILLSNTNLLNIINDVYKEDFELYQRFQLKK